MDSLKLVVVKNPFNRADKETMVLEYHRPSIAQIIIDHAPLGLDVIVSINGVVIPVEEFNFTFPGKGDEIVIMPYIHGSDNGKQVLRVVMMIVVAVVAQWAGGALAKAYFGGSAIAAAGFTAAFMAIGGVLINTLVPPIQPDGPGERDTSAAYGWNPQLTQQQGIGLSRWYGRHRINTGNIIASYIESSVSYGDLFLINTIFNGDSIQYINALISYGLGPFKRMYDFRVNDQPIENYQGVTVETRLGYLNQPVIPNFDDTKIEYNVGSIVSSNDPVVYRTVGNDFDAFEVEIVAPQGIWYANDNGGLSVNSVEVLAQYRKVDPGPELWTGTVVVGAGWVDNLDGTFTATAASTAISVAAGVTIGDNYTSSFEIVSSSAGTVRATVGDTGLGTIQSVVDTYSEDIVAAGTVTDIAFLGASFTGTIRPISVKLNKPWSNLSNSLSQLFPVSFEPHWAAGTWYTNDGVTKFISHFIGTGDIDAHHEGEHYLWQPYVGVFINTIWHWIDGPSELVAFLDFNDYSLTPVTLIGNKTKPFRHMLKVGSYIVATGFQYDIKITKVTADREDTRYGDLIQLGKVNEIQNDNFTYPRHTLASIRALATDQLSGSFRFSMMVDAAIINTYNGTSWELQYSNNPAWVCYDVLTQPVLSGSGNSEDILRNKAITFETPFVLIGGNVGSIDGTQITAKTMTYVDGLVGQSGDIKLTIAAITYGSGFDVYLGSGTTPISITGSYTAIHTLDAGRTSDDVIISVPSGVEVTYVYAIVMPEAPEGFTIERYDGIDPARLDYVKFKEWADYCDGLVNDGKGGTEKRCTFNGVFDSETTMWEAALVVCTVGRAMLLWEGTTISVFIDKPASPTQLFSIGNIEVDSFSESFLTTAERASEIEVDFINEEKDYTRDKFTVINSNIANASNKISMNLQGVTKPSEAYRLAMLRLLQNQFIVRVMSWKAAIDAITCQIGDVVYLQHNVPQWGQGGRIVSNTTLSITVDQPIVFLVGVTYQIIFRGNDDTLHTRTLTNAVTEDSYLGDEASDILVDELGYMLLSGPTIGDLVLTFDTTLTGDFTQCPYSVGAINQSTKPVRVINMKKDQDQFVELTAVDYNETIYNVDTDTPVMPTYNYSNLPATMTVDNLIATERLENLRGIVSAVVDLSFEITNVSFFEEIELYYRIGNGNINYHSNVTVGNTEIRNLLEGQTYTFYVIPVNYFGHRPLFQNASSVTLAIIGKTAPPSALTNVNLSLISGNANFTWTQPPELDVQIGGEIAIRHSKKTSGAIWDDGSDVAIVSGISSSLQGLPPLSGTYMFKVYDSTGNQSTITSYNTSTIPQILQFNAVTTLQEETTFTGTKVDMSVISNTLRLTEAGGFSPTSGSYAFASGYDLGSVQTSRLTSNIEALFYDISTNIDSILTNIDTWSSFDGADVTGISYQLQVRTTDDDPAGSPTWGSWENFTIGDYTCRAYEFRLLVTNTNMNANIAIAVLQVTIDMPDRVEGAQSIASGTGGKAITYTNAFQSVPANAIAGHGMATGDYFTITSKTVSGFTVEFFNSSATSINITFDWLAKGY